MIAVDPATRPNREAPASIEAERELIGAVLYENGTLEKLDAPLPATAFYETLHARMWAAMCDRINSGQLAEPVWLAEKLKGDPGFEQAGAMRYLADLLERAAPYTAQSHAQTIADLAIRREIIGVCSEASARAALDRDASGFEVLAGLEIAASNVAHGGSQASAWQEAGRVAAAAISAARTANGNMGLSTGLSELDEAIGGLRKGQLVIVAGRPAMGKSTAGLQIAKGVGRRGRGVLFFSLEMPDFDLGLRMACDVAHDPGATRYMGRSINPCYFDAAKGRLTEQQWLALDRAREDIAAWPLAFDTRPGLTVSTMLALGRRKLRSWERQGIEPGAVIVDHLTIARAEQDRRGNRVAEVGDISRGLAEMAKIIDVPVVALCQLSRDVEKRNEKDRRPNLSDLRWSGEIEQDARVVMFLYRPEYYIRPPEDATDFEAESEYRSKLEKHRRKLFWLIEKNNNGPTGQIETYCDIACSAIRDKIGAYNQ